MKRISKAKPGELKIQWGKLPDDNPDIVISHGGSGAGKPDAHLLYQVFCCQIYGFKGYEDRRPSFVDQLKERGYDITTIKFSVMRHPDAQGPKES